MKFACTDKDQTSCSPHGERAEQNFRAEVFTVEVRESWPWHSAVVDCLRDIEAHDRHFEWSASRTGLVTKFRIVGTVRGQARFKEWHDSWLMRRMDGS